MFLNKLKTKVIHTNESYRVYKVLNSDTYIVAHECMLGTITIKAYNSKKWAINKCDKLATLYKSNNNIIN